MILKTKDFQEATNKILLAVSVDSNAANLELETKEKILYLRVTNREYYVEVKFNIDSDEAIHAVVDAKLFLNLISGLATEELKLKANETNIEIKAGKSSYKLPMICESSNSGTITLIDLPIIEIDKVNVTMPISKDILDSILNINGREIQKAKRLDVNELQKLFYIDETGCFTFTTGACVNNFELAKPVKLLLNERVVKLFKLFNGNATLEYGHSVESDGSLKSVIVLKNDDVYVAARITCDDTLISKVQGPCEGMRSLIAEQLDHTAVVSASVVSAAISRLLMFHKNSTIKADMTFVPAKVTINDAELVISDEDGNSESILVDNEHIGQYDMGINLVDLKSVLDSCKNDHITLNFGNHRAVIITRGPISNVIPETKAAN